jgi:recombination protein RecA
MATDGNRDKALDLAVASIEKAYGKGAIMRLGKREAAAIEVIPSGSLSLDLALGVGGYPKGRIIEVYGPESSGKTTLALHAIAECQRNGGVAAFIDAEHALDVSYARKLGVNTEELLVSQPDFGEQALEIADTLVSSCAVDIIVVDSVAALVPKAEIEGEMGDTHVGLQARLMSQALRKLTGNVHRSNTMLFFINQIRMKIGVMFGSPETTTGGNALKFYSSVRLDVRRVGAIKVGENAIGNRTRVKVVKNKLAPPFTACEFDILFGEGISKSGDALDLGVEANLIEKSGAWYTYAGERIGQGRETARVFLKEHPAALAEIERNVLKSKGVLREAPPSPPGASDAQKAGAKTTSKNDSATSKAEPAKAEASKAEASKAETSKADARPDASANAVPQSANRPRPRA